MTKPEISNLVRIQTDPEYWYTVEDFNIDVGPGGFTISYWQISEGREKRHDYVTVEEESALAIADAIYKLFKKEDDS